MHAPIALLPCVLLLARVGHADELPPQLSIGEPAIRGELGRRDVLTVLEGHVPELAKCYPDGSTAIEIELAITPGGRVHSAVARGDKTISSCVTRVARDLVFPRAKHMSTVAVSIAT